MNLIELDKENDRLSLKSLINAGLYNSEEDVIHDALKYLLQAHPDYKLKIAMYRYQTEDISLGKAAEIAEVSMETMKRFLMKNGVRPELGPETIEEANQECLELQEILNESNRE
jgi:predicted HTH domain antitoxin